MIFGIFGTKRTVRIIEVSARNVPSFTVLSHCYFLVSLNLLAVRTSYFKSRC